MTDPAGEEPTTREVTARNLATVLNGVIGVQLTPKKVLALILGLGLPVVVAVGWVLGQRQATGTPSDGSGAMGTAPHEQVPSPAAQYDVYEDAPTVVPMASTSAVPSPRPKDAGPKNSQAPQPTVQPTVVPEDQTPSPEPSPAETTPSPEEPSAEPEG
ncbi:hypothetical protein Ais01nite_30010 [Asanoa ishikariensis]|uniref:Uncharacterized protein n=1 Tax=Asanoa ishikariensis TaxID=137265 RepID=A0A1H3QK59_9ACTN|nr:hypothetical protein [Asanoa ishikariensis]GIF64966.1 hypothetical protein Ais01nite_30010 [Asanoa ishikariensis]SDZ13491.1 hypothetical protein SAMN05421684_2921 [Asanoa ishikariensis]